MRASRRLPGRIRRSLPATFHTSARTGSPRLQLLDVLARNEGGVCVCDLEAAVPVKQPTVSHHLRLLREAGLIESEKVGQWVYYRIKRDSARALRDRVQQVLRAFA